MKLLTTKDLTWTEFIFATTFTPNTIRVNEPERFPFIDALANTMLERDLPNGHLFAYMRVRFVGSKRSALWMARSARAAGRQSIRLLRQLNPMQYDDKWTAHAMEAIPGDWPVRERVYLAWLQGDLPDSVLIYPAPVTGRVIPSSRTEQNRLKYPPHRA